MKKRTALARSACLGVAWGATISALLFYDHQNPAFFFAVGIWLAATLADIAFEWLDHPTRVIQPDL